MFFVIKTRRIAKLVTTVFTWMGSHADLVPKIVAFVSVRDFVPDVKRDFKMKINFV